jgi:hypothetical protein
MKRWLGRIVIFALFVCCALVTTCWITSYLREDRALMSRDGRCVQIVSHRGRLSYFTLAEYPTPLPWIWEHDEGPIQPPGRAPQLRGIGRTLEIVLIPRNEDSWGPLAISEGQAYTDPYGQKVLARRLTSIPQYVSPQKTPTVQRPAIPLPRTSDETVDQLVKAARSLEEPRELQLSPSSARTRKPSAGSQQLDLGSNDAFSLGIVPSTERKPVRAARDGGFGIMNGSGTSSPINFALNRAWSYAYRATEVPYSVLFLVPFVPLAGLAVLTWRRRQVRQSRRRDGRCLACGYDLHGSRAEKCPECGALTLTAPTPAPAT